MIRLFTGLALPKEICDDIALLRGGMPGARWVEAADFHITLQFIGNVEEHVAAELHAALTRLRKPAVEVILERIDVFGSRKPRSVVVTARSTPGLMDLQLAHERICRRHAVDVAARHYTPHVTLARVGLVGSGDVADYFQAQGYFRPRIFTAESFCLYSSARSAGGGPYTVEAEYELRI